MLNSHFGRTLEGIDETLASAPKFVSYVNTDTRRSARKMFKLAFPNFIQMRNAVAHSGDKIKNENRQLKHAFVGAWENKQISFVDDGNPMEMVLIDVLNQRQYSNSIEKQITSYEISLESLKKLSAVRDKIYSAFQPLTRKHN